MPDTSAEEMAVLRKVTGAASVHTADEVGALPWTALDGLEHVRQRLLWRSGESCAGVLRVHPRGEVEPHAHTTGHHHIWVLEGHARMLDRDVGAGAYVHVPAGQDHAVSDVGPEGVTYLYVYIDERHHAHEPHLPAQR